MRQRRLGAGGPTVGAVGLGCMGMTYAYGPGERDDAESQAVLHRAVELGVTFLDTADVYGPFTNEELVGRALRGLGERRASVTLASKGGLVLGAPGDPRSVRRDGRPEHLRAAAEASLRRLGVDVIDLYYLHRVDPEVPLAESWGALAELVAAGTVRRIGLSEVSVAELETAQAVHPVAAVQSELSLWTREPLAEVVPWCADHGAAFVPFSPLGRGYLTGALSSSTFDEQDFRAHNPRFTPEAMAANRALVETVREVATEVGATPAQVAIAWVLARGEHVVPIPGTKKLRYLEENATAGDLDLPADALAALDELPAPVGARY